jgi:hypothetical protein
MWPRIGKKIRLDIVAWTATATANELHWDCAPWSMKTAALGRSRPFGQPPALGNRPIAVTATPTELTAPRRGLVAALQHALPRDELFAGLYVVACANGLLGRSIYTLNLEGWRGSFSPLA